MTDIESAAEKFRNQLGDLAPRVTLSVRHKSPIAGLQDALSRFITGRRDPAMPVEVNDDLELIFKAAKRVADLDWEAAGLMLQQKLNGLRRAQGRDPTPKDYGHWLSDLVYAALGIGDNDDLLDRINQAVSSKASKEQTKKVIKDIDDFRADLSGVNR